MKDTSLKDTSLKDAREPDKCLDDAGDTEDEAKHSVQNWNSRTNIANFKSNCLVSIYVHVGMFKFEESQCYYYEEKMYVYPGSLIYVIISPA